MTIQSEHLEPWRKAKEFLQWQSQIWKMQGKEETHKLIGGVMDTLAILPWAGNIKGFESEEPIYELARYTTNDWLTNVHESQMLNLLKKKIHRIPGGFKIKIENTYFYGFLQKAYKTHQTKEYETNKYFIRACKIGHALFSGLRRQVAFLVNINGNHWVAVILDFKHDLILLGDLLDQNKHAMTDILEWWTEHHSGCQFTVQPLAITHQQDIFSCGLLSFNALAHHFLPNLYPLIDAMLVANGRLEMMLEVIEQHLNQVHTPSLLYDLWLNINESKVSNQSAKILNLHSQHPLQVTPLPHPSLTRVIASYLSLQILTFQVMTSYHLIPSM
jgi:hypothetical protein